MRCRRQCVLSLVVASLSLAAGCATIPTGPSVMVLPAVGTSFEQFQADDAVCCAWTHQQAGGKTPASQAAAASATGAVTR